MNISAFIILINKPKSQHGLIHYWKYLSMIAYSDDRDDLRREAFAVLRSSVGLQPSSTKMEFSSLLSNKELLLAVREDDSCYWNTAPALTTMHQAKLSFEAAYEKCALTMPYQLTTRLTRANGYSDTCSLGYLVEVVTQHGDNNPDTWRILDEVINAHPMVECGDEPLKFKSIVILNSKIRLEVDLTQHEFDTMTLSDGVFACHRVGLGKSFADSVPLY